MTSTHAGAKLRSGEIVDKVELCDFVNESQHKLQGDNTIGSGAHDRRWRGAFDGGYFSYRVKVLPDAPVNLALSFWGGDGGPRTYDVVVDDTRIATLSSVFNQPDRWVDVSIPINEQLTKGRNSVRIRIHVANNKLVGVYGFAIVKR